MRNLQMHIVHVVERHAPEDGGLTAAVEFIARQCIAHGHRSTILAYGDKAEAPPPGVRVVKVPAARFGARWMWSPYLKDILERTLVEEAPDILHIHGVWMAPHWYASRLATMHQIPTVLTPHGMLQTWLLDNQGWVTWLKKRAYWRLVARPAFCGVSVLHAITTLESRTLAAFLPEKRTEVIPNAVDLTQCECGADEREGEPEKIIVFVGRIHPVKGVDLLIKAFAAASLERGWHLALIGPVENQEYAEHLRSMVHEIGLEYEISFLGPIFGQQKYHWLRRAWVVVVPSYSEAMGMVNLESAACCTPSVTTTATGLEDWTEGGGLVCEPNLEDLTARLRAACAWSLRERLSRGRASRALVERKYAGGVIGPRWMSLYRELSESS